MSKDNYLELFNKSNLSYVDIAYQLGCCELTARKKINGTTKVTKAEEVILNQLLKGENESCIISNVNH